MEKRETEQVVLLDLEIPFAARALNAASPTHRGSGVLSAPPPLFQVERFGMEGARDAHQQG